MPSTSRRLFLGALAFGASAVSVVRAFAAAGDGHAAGYDVAPASNFMPLVPRKSGDAVMFSTSLDKAPIKATSGGWAREITTRSLPLATGIAGAHLFLNPGGSREMHWHNSAEWAYVLGGRCQVTIVDPAGETEVVNYAPGDLWYFPKGHSHAIATLGTEPFHAILAFDDGLYSENGTFGVSDWMSRLDQASLERALGMANGGLSKIPAGETYINQGEVIPLDSPQARAEKVLDRARTHRFRLMAQPAHASSNGGALHVASAREFPMSSTMSAMFLKLKPGAVQQPHWHANANEWQYVVKGRNRVTLFATDKRMAVAELGPGDCAYLPRGCGHSIENIGNEESETVGVWDSGTFSESTLADWLAHAPRHLLANNLAMHESAVPHFEKRPLIVASTR
jgi:oxalate decarboxylase